MSPRLLLICILSLLVTAVHAKPNLLLITVDDMSADSLGAFGCKLADTSPNIDKLATESLKFTQAHVQVGNCYPSRNVMWSGRYPHNTGVEGFYQVKPTDYPHLVDVMQGAGYYVAIRGKVSHSTPYQPYHWDDDLTRREDGTQEHIKDVESYGRSTARGIAQAREAGKPFCININISDPHKPFWKPGDEHPSSREFTAKEVPVPGYLPDDPAIREELALYYTSVRRADDALGSVMKALEESGEVENTFILFLSDHGMPLPFAKTQLYHHSSNTPLLVKWPGVTKAGSVDSEHLVSAVDLLPTLCDVIGLEDKPEGFDGRSFEPLLRGEEMDGWDMVYKVYNENAGGNRHPMRAIQTKNYLYLFNPWSDGADVFRTATQGTVSYRRMKELAKTDDAVAARLDLFDHRVVEELYHASKDPDCLKNLVDSPEHAETLATMRTQMETYITETGDHALEAWENRNDPAAMRAYVDKKTGESDERRAKKRKNKKPNDGKKKSNAKKKKKDDE